MGFMYRARQFWRALTAAPDAESLRRARSILSPELWVLFSSLRPSEQAHSLSVFRQLIEENETDADLLTAALLHDVGKSRYPLPLWERMAIVLGRNAFPEQARRWGRAKPSGWRRPFVIAEQHAGWGGEMAAQAGASEMVQSLIRRHQEIVMISSTASLEDRLLSRLQRFDNES
jgi:hypothetical protein